MIRIGTKDDKEIWNKAVLDSNHGTIFHTWDWLKIIEEQGKGKLYPLMIYKGSQLTALYPLFIQKKGFVKVAFSPPPGSYLLYLGPVIPGYDDLKQHKKESVLMKIQDEVDKYLFSEIKCKYVRIRSAPGILDARPFKWSGYDIEPVYTYRLDLKKGINCIWSEFDRKLRVSINHCIKEGVTVRDGDRYDLEYILDSLSRRYREQGYRPSDYMDYINELYNKFYPDNMKIFVACYNNQSVGGMISIIYEDLIYMWVGVPKSELKGIYPNDLIQWELIKWACGKGLNYFEEMDSGDDLRLVKFKSKFNPEIGIWYNAEKYASNNYKIMKKANEMYNQMYHYF
ncbi:GNAT family N-acetyltransferase [Methanoplanus sp. FWC-SCC4]|uniref:GNAT family N-acetyltransferase n=1 Tax=Methanochimaera problematica TaxID=2609417 RepID=A0AA97FBF8_9EURY|nr:GNAT family N-acetyltransferase [Methanoplanus sp. FWC-SCC4]WOF16345.1 GNAT family N-acetyltransferase [Methanoplanus sp. FWC-SCC4]